MAKTRPSNLKFRPAVRLRGKERGYPGTLVELAPLAILQTREQNKPLPSHPVASRSTVCNDCFRKTITIDVAHITRLY